MDYAAAAFTPGMKPAEMESMTENVQESVADAALIGAQPAATWKDSQTGAMYVLVKLEHGRCRPADPRPDHRGRDGQA